MNRNAPEYYRDSSVADSMEATRACIAHIERVDPKHHLLNYVLTPRFAICCEGDLLSQLGQLGQEGGMRTQTHFNEAEQEILATKDLFPEFDNEADLYAHYGLLTDRSILAHCCIMTDYEFRKLAAAGAGVAHCPIANMTVGGGFMAAPIRSFLNYGIKVGLGTDSGGGFSSSMLDAIRQALIASYSREASSKGKEPKLSIEEVFYLATQGGADVCGLGSQVGNFDKGKAFDALIIDTDVDGVMAPREEHDSFRVIFEKFLLTGDDRDIREVFVITTMAPDEHGRKGSVATIIEQPTEDTPLLERKESHISVLWSKSVVYRVLLTGFLVSLSFGVTQVPLIYVFGVMTCDEYYKSHPDAGLGLLQEPGLGHNRCQIHAIEASTARSVALLGTSTTLFGVINLFFTGWTMKAFGVKKALMLTVFFPAVRLAVQNIGVEAGANLGILIVQCSQMITVVGGPVGYLLALNSLATEVVESAERTGTLGRLSGCAMFGTAIGYLAGGLIGDYLGIIWPFRVTLALFILCCIYIQLCLPEIHNKEVEAKASKSLSSFFDPIKMFAPQKFIRPNGHVHKEYGVLFLGIGTFLGVLATSYIPVLLQMYSTDVFGFGTSENGFLISINSLVRGFFLTFAFPHIISKGRK
ncbi:Metallo-dependent hydrolase, partial [Hortaea werneckii]